MSTSHPAENPIPRLWCVDEAAAVATPIRKHGRLGSADLPDKLADDWLVAI